MTSPDKATTFVEALLSDSFHVSVVFDVPFIGALTNEHRKNNDTNDDGDPDDRVSHSF